MATKRPTLKSFRKKALQNPEVKAEYDALSAAFDMKRQMIALRKDAGLTQEQMAELLGTKKSNISRLESINSDISPRLATVEEYARVLGYSMKVGFERSGRRSIPERSPE
jgi:DNA-binding XRE family transcriptional regulator